MERVANKPRLPFTALQRQPLAGLPGARQIWNLWIGSRSNEFHEKRAMHSGDQLPRYAVPPPGGKIVMIASRWARLATNLAVFNLFFDLSRCSEQQILVDDSALALARRAATEYLAGADPVVATRQWKLCNGWTA